MPPGLRLSSSGSPFTPRRDIVRRGPLPTPVTRAETTLVSRLGWTSPNRKLLMDSSNARGTLLLTRATGFVGRHTRAALESAGWHVRCATRNVDRAYQRWPVSPESRRGPKAADASDTAHRRRELPEGVAAG